MTKKMWSSIPFLGGIAASILVRKKFPKYCYEQEVSQSPCVSPNLIDGTRCISVQIAKNATCVPMNTVTIVPENSLLTKQAVVAPNPPTANQPAGLSSYPSTNPKIQCECQSQGPFSGNVCTQMLCKPLYTGELYIEIAGGSGANHVWYTDLNEKVEHIGGKSGRLFGTLPVTPNDSIGIQFGFSAKKTTPVDIATESLPEVPLGGGTGTLLSGSSGGGSTVVSVNGIVSMVAAGGGGASKNADGGDAGCSEDFTLLDTVQLSTNGRAGFVNTIQQITESVYLSGGGATGNAPGFSKDPNGRGSKLSGGSATEALSSGGGGGSGYYGGGAGYTNEKPKPANTHGAGGGGSCYVRQNVFYNSLSGTKFTNKNSSAVDLKSFPRNTYVTFGFPTGP